MLLYYKMFASFICPLLYLPFPLWGKWVTVCQTPSKNGGQGNTDTLSSVSTAVNMVAHLS